MIKKHFFDRMKNEESMIYSYFCLTLHIFSYYLLFSLLILLLLSLIIDITNIANVANIFITNPACEMLLLTTTIIIIIFIACVIIILSSFLEGPQWK